MMSQHATYSFCGNVADKEFVVRETRSGEKVLNIVLIRNWGYKKEDGTEVKKNERLKVAIFGPAAQKAARELQTGFRVLVSTEYSPEIEEPYTNPEGKVFQGLKVNVRSYRSFGKWVPTEAPADEPAKSE